MNQAFVPLGCILFIDSIYITGCITGKLMVWDSKCAFHSMHVAHETAVTVLIADK